MKNFFYFCLFVVMFILPVTSCQKDDELSSFDFLNIKSQLASIPALSKEQARQILLGNLKSGQLETDDVLVEVFPLSEETFDISASRAIKYSVYLEIDSNGYISKMITISQSFNVSGGKIDVEHPDVSYQVGCSFSREFFLKEDVNVSGIIYFFRFDDGRQLAFVGRNNNIFLIPIAGADKFGESDRPASGKVAFAVTY